MQTKHRLTRAEQVLLAASSLEKRGVSPFSAEDLVVESWKLFKNSFSLQGYDLPDSNRVFMEMMGNKPLKAKGWLEKVGSKQYRLSGAGRLAAEALSPPDSEEGCSKSSIDREQLRIAMRLRNSRAMKKFQSGEWDSVTFTDACSFWDISPRSTASVLEARFSSIASILDILHKTLAETDYLQLTGLESVSAGEIEAITFVHVQMQVKFALDLAVIRSRTDERGQQPRQRIV